MWRILANLLNGIRGCDIVTDTVKVVLMAGENMVGLAGILLGDEL